MNEKKSRVRACMAIVSSRWMDLNRLVKGGKGIMGTFFRVFGGIFGW